MTIVSLGQREYVGTPPRSDQRGEDNRGDDRES
jgi:hypothetical protein